MSKLKTMLVLLLVALGPSLGSVEAADTEDLFVLKAKVRFGKPGRGDSLKVKGTFAPGVDLGSGSAISFRVGPVEVLSVTTYDPGPKFVHAEKQPGPVKFVIDAVKGRFKLSARGLDLDGLRSAGPEDVTFTLVIDGTSLTGKITMGARDGRWRFRYVPGSGGWPPGLPGINPGGGGGGGGGTGGGAAVGFRTLGRKAPYGGPTNFGTVIARTDSVYRSEWISRFGFGPPTGYAPPAPVPFVDFTKEMVVFIDIGVRPTSGFSVDVMKVTEQGTGLKIEWRETRPGANCALLSALTYPCVAIAVPLRDGPVTYSGSARTVNCP